MSPRKLTEDDKQNMLELYRNSKATTSTLAQEFGVSSSTVSRFLKNSLSQEEYEELIQQKRLARTPRGDRQKAETTAEASPAKKKLSQQIVLQSKAVTQDDEQEAQIIETAEPSVSSQHQIVAEPEDSQESVEQSSVKQITTAKRSKPEKKLILAVDKDKKTDIEEEEEDIEDVDVAALSAMLGEEIDDDDDDDEEDDDDNVDDDDISYPHTSSNSQDLEILPLSAASFPRTCYLVVDRSAELIAKPLQEFADLGVIPNEEIQQKTLPVFDNHRIAKRFSHRREKVIKVPDGKMLQKTAQYLYDKGITRLLIKGQIYALSDG